MESGIFGGIPAWFSSSVIYNRRQKWVDEGGNISDIETAKYIFSDDPTCEDTTQVFTSEAYMRDHIAIFHSSYVDECVRVRDLHQVVLGDYFLPPPAVLEQVADKISFKYNISDSASIPEDSTRLIPAEADSLQLRRTSTDHDESVARTLRSSHNSTKSISANAAEYIRLDSLPVVTGGISDFVVGQNGCHVTHVNG